MQVVRERKRVDLQVELGEMPAQFAGLETDKPQEESPDNGPGLTVKSITPELARANKLSRESGVVITAVGPDLRGKLLEGDVILKVNDTTIQNLEQYRAAIAEARKAKQKFVVLTVERLDEDGKKMTDIEDVSLQ